MTSTAKSPDSQIEQPAPVACDHNGFAHRLFPNIAIGTGAEILDLLASGGKIRADVLSSAFELVECLYPRDESNAVLFMKDIVVSEELVQGRRLVVLALTPATEPIGVHFIGLLAKSSISAESEPPFRYLTFERQGGADNSAVLCEWACRGPDDLVHQNLGLTGAPTKESFLEMVTAMLAFRR